MPICLQPLQYLPEATKYDNPGFGDKSGLMQYKRLFLLFQTVSSGIPQDFLLQSMLKMMNSFQQLPKTPWLLYLSFGIGSPDNKTIDPGLIVPACNPMLLVQLVGDV